MPDMPCKWPLQVAEAKGRASTRLDFATMSAAMKLLPRSVSAYFVSTICLLVQAQAGYLDSYAWYGARHRFLTLAMFA